MGVRVVVWELSNEKEDCVINNLKGLGAPTILAVKLLVILDLVYKVV